MKFGIRQIIISMIAGVLAITVVVFMANNAAAIGAMPLPVRAAILSIAVLAAMIAMYPFNALFTGKPGAYAIFVCVPALTPGLVYYLLLLPQQAGSGFEAAQLRSQLITERSSNGFVEVGFSYPIFTPTITVTNRELFTREVNVFLRMIDTNNESTLFRAVRSRIPGSSLSVESTVSGMLEENDGYLFLPLVIPPISSLEGKVVFVISNLDDGTTFNDALGSAYQAVFELREPETGELLLEFPLQHL